ncbi:hypothetical protein ACJX0J_013516 [Zea mays]
MDLIYKHVSVADVDLIGHKLDAFRWNLSSDGQFSCREYVCKDLKLLALLGAATVCSSFGYPLAPFLGCATEAYLPVRHAEISKTSICIFHVMYPTQQFISFEKAAEDAGFLEGIRHMSKTGESVMNLLEYIHQGISLHLLQQRTKALRPEDEDFNMIVLSEKILFLFLLIWLVVTVILLLSIQNSATRVQI